MDIVSRVYDKLVWAGAIMLLHGIAFRSTVKLWRDKSLLDKYPLYKDVNGIAPLAFPNKNEDAYLLVGTQICIIKVNKYLPDSGYVFINLDAEDVSFDYIVENYSEKKVEPLLFHINLFSQAE